MAVRRGAWSIVCLFHVVQTSQGQVDTCTLPNNEACIPRPVDVATGCATGTVNGDCAAGGISGAVCFSRESATDDAVCDVAASCTCFSGVCFNAGFTDVCAVTTGGTGDPHMTGLSGQKFDFSGEDGGWYALVKDQDLQLNMRVTAPVPDVAAITYITGVSIATKDLDGFPHTMVVTVKEPEVLDSQCPLDLSPCLANGALKVLLDDVEVSSPSHVTLGPSVSFGAVNIPGECRSFGFEKYWARKVLAAEEEAAGASRRLVEQPGISMAEWIVSDMLATNMPECTSYVEESSEELLFSHQSEHVSFQIVTPAFTMRLNYGKLHQVAMRDPTGQFDLPDHITHQMNVSLSHLALGDSPQGVLGETRTVRKDAHGNSIMTGLAAIGGAEKDYQVNGAVGTIFKQSSVQFRGD